MELDPEWNPAVYPQADMNSSSNIGTVGHLSTRSNPLAKAGILSKIHYQERASSVVFVPLCFKMAAWVFHQRSGIDTADERSSEYTHGFVYEHRDAPAPTENPNPKTP